MILAFKRVHFHLCSRLQFQSFLLIVTYVCYLFFTVALLKPELKTTSIHQSAWIITGIAFIHLQLLRKYFSPSLFEILLIFLPILHIVYFSLLLYHFTLSDYFSYCFLNLILSLVSWESYTSAKLVKIALFYTVRLLLPSQPQLLLIVLITYRYSIEILLFNYSFNWLFSECLDLRYFNVMISHRW